MQIRMYKRPLEEYFDLPVEGRRIGPLDMSQKEVDDALAQEHPEFAEAHSVVVFDDKALPVAWYGWCWMSGAKKHVWLAMPQGYLKILRDSVNYGYKM